MTLSHYRFGTILLTALVAMAFAAAQQPERGTRRPQRAPRPEAAQPAKQKDSQREKVRVEPARRRSHKQLKISTFTLKHAEVEYVAGLLSRMQRVFEERMMVCPAERTNTLVVAVENEQTLAQLRELIETLDAPSHGGLTEDVHQAVSLKHAFAPEIVEYLEQLAPRTPALRFVADRQANTVWLAGSPELVADAAQLVEEMEERTAAADELEKATPRELRFYGLKHANPWELREALVTVAKATDSRLSVVIASGTLIVHAPPAMHAVAAEIIGKLDVPSKRHIERKKPEERGGRKSPAPEKPSKERPSRSGGDKRG